MVGRQLAVAVRADDQQPRHAPCLDDMSQQQERRLVGPLQVVEHEDGGRAGRRRSKQRGHCGEQRPSVGLEIGRRRRVHAGHPVRHGGHQPGQVRQLAAAHRLQCGLREVRDEVTEGFDPHAVRHGAVLVAPPEQHGRAACVRGASDLGRKRGLADARLAGDHHDARGSDPRVLQRGVEHLAL